MSEVERGVTNDANVRYIFTERNTDISAGRISYLCWNMSRKKESKESKEESYIMEEGTGLKSQKSQKIRNLLIGAKKNESKKFKEVLLGLCSSYAEETIENSIFRSPFSSVVPSESIVNFIIPYFQPFLKHGHKSCILSVGPGNGAFERVLEIVLNFKFFWCELNLESYNKKAAESEVGTETFLDFDRGFQWASWAGTGDGREERKIEWPRSFDPDNVRCLFFCMPHLEKSIVGQGEYPEDAIMDYLREFKNVTKMVFVGNYSCAPVVTKEYSICAAMKKRKKAWRKRRKKEVKRSGGSFKTFQDLVRSGFECYNDYEINVIVIDVY